MSRGHTLQSQLSLVIAQLDSGGSRHVVVSQDQGAVARRSACDAQVGISHEGALVAVQLGYRS